MAFLTNAGSMNRFFEDHLIEQPAIQIMEHELGWEVEGERILNVGFWILNGRGRWERKMGEESPAESGSADGGG